MWSTYLRSGFYTIIITVPGVKYQKFFNLYFINYLYIWHALQQLCNFMNNKEYFIIIMIKSEDNKKIIRLKITIQNQYLVVETFYYPVILYKLFTLNRLLCFGKMLVTDSFWLSFLNWSSDIFKYNSNILF